MSHSSTYMHRITHFQVRFVPPSQDGCNKTFQKNLEYPLPCGPTDRNTPPGARYLLLSTKRVGSAVPTVSRKTWYFGFGSEAMSCSCSGCLV